MKVCNNCGIEHEGTYGSGRFCSMKCSRGFSTKSKRIEINKNVRKLFEERYPQLEKKCPECENTFLTKKKEQECCSRSCAMKFRNKQPDVNKTLSERFSKLTKARYQNGDTTIGWQSRKNMKMSTLEKFANDFLIKHNFIFEREHKVGKWFIDFAFVESKLALELDGKQHEQEKRINSDKLKDEYLIANGWQICRIPYWEKDKEGKILQFANMGQRSTPPAL